MALKIFSTEWLTKLKELLGFYEATVDFTGSGNFTAGTVVVTRVGRQVTISETIAFTHASLNTAASAVGALPSWAMPSSSVLTTVVGISASAFISRVDVFNDGTLRFRYYDQALVLTSQTGNSGLTISYNV